MAAFTWDPKYSVDIKNIDEEHKKLFSMINDLSEGMKAGKDKEVLGKVLTDLINYTKSHFAKEEKLMQTHAYPEFAVHKMQHDSLTKKAVEMKEKHDSGEIALSVQVSGFLRDWLTKHILGTYKKYTEFFNSKGIN